MDIERNLQVYLQDREPTARYTSFDYCFNHFQSHRDELASPSGMQLSCLHLGFYLASWGMLRGSSALLTRSIKHYAPVIEVIASADSSIWEIDAHTYTDEAIRTLMETASKLRLALCEGASDILVTKIMLGVFGCVPAFDTYFKKGFEVATFGRKSLLKVAKFYQANSKIIEKYRVPTLDFASGKGTTWKYTRAKVIDMIFFVEGATRTESAKFSSGTCGLPPPESPDEGGGAQGQRREESQPLPEAGLDDGRIRGDGAHLLGGQLTAGHLLRVVEAALDHRLADGVAQLGGGG